MWTPWRLRSNGLLRMLAWLQHLRSGARQASEQFRWSHIAAEHLRLYAGV